METTTKRPPSWAVFCAYAGGLLLALVPALVELVVGEFILLLPIALVLAILSLWPLRGTSAHRVFGIAFALALVTEFGEQILFPDRVPKWADIAPPLFFTISGIALILSAREATRALNKASLTARSSA